MKDIIRKNFTANQNNTNKNTDGTAKEIEEEIEQFRMQFSKTQSSNDSAWNSSVLRVLFKNESFARKYKVKIEKFLKDLLEEGEEFIVYHPTHNCDEKEFAENHQEFHIDNVNESFDNTNSSQKVPVYSSTYEDTLHCNKEVVAEEIEEEKPSMMTCFNCLGDHHMKKCPDQLDWARINANKKDILAGSAVRYHTDDQNNGLKPGIISDDLRNALGLKENQLPKFIYHMRVIGYPPGWMEEAVFEKSGLFLFDTNGEAVKDESSSPETGTLYDGTKFVDFPGFNSPVPEDFIDEWKALNMPPLQPHQQLKEALKSPNIINKNMHKRRHNVSCDNIDFKKQRNVAEDSHNPLSKTSISQNNLTSPGHSGKSFGFKTPDSKQKRQSMSISMSPGTPVLDQSNPYQKLPNADKFAQGITEHLPFENLPDSVGTYEKMRGVISCVQKKLNDIKSS